MKLNNYTAAQRDWEWFWKSLTLAGGHFCRPLGIVPLPYAGDDARPLQLVLGRTLEGDDRPDGCAVAMNDLQGAQLGRGHMAALPCRTNTRGNAI